MINCYTHTHIQPDHSRACVSLGSGCQPADLSLLQELVDGSACYHCHKHHPSSLRTVPDFTWYTQQHLTNYNDTHVQPSTLRVGVEIFAVSLKVVVGVTLTDKVSRHLSPTKQHK